MKQTWHCIRYKLWETQGGQWQVYEDQDTFDFVLLRKVGTQWDERGRFAMVWQAFDAAKGVEDASL